MKACVQYSTASPSLGPLNSGSVITPVWYIRHVARQNGHVPQSQTTKAVCGPPSAIWMELISASPAKLHTSASQVWSQSSPARIE